MHSLLALVVAASGHTTTTKASTTSSSGSDASLIFIVVIALAAYFLFIRPRSQAARRQRDTLQEVGPGDEILTAAGIFGTVLDVQSDRLTIETAPGTRLTILKSTVARRITPDTMDPDYGGAEPPEDHDWHSDEDDEHSDDHDDEHSDDHDVGSNGSGGVGSEGGHGST